MTAHRVGIGMAPVAPSKPQHEGTFQCGACFALARANGLSLIGAMIAAARCTSVRHHL